MEIQMKFVSIQDAKNKSDIKTKKLRNTNMAGANNKFFVEEDVLDRNSMPYKKIKVKDKKFLIKKSDIGKRVYWSGDTMNKYYELVDIKSPEEIGYADGAYIISKSGTRFPINCYVDEVILHPNNFKKSRKKRKKS